MIILVDHLFILTMMHTLKLQTTPNPQLLTLGRLFLGRVSNWKHTQSSVLFHEGDQILAINDLLTDSLGELQTYLKRLAKDQVRVHVKLAKCFLLLKKCFTLISLSLAGKTDYPKTARVPTLKWMLHVKCPLL